MISLYKTKHTGKHMIDKIGELDHPDSIWTWKTAKGRRKATLWLPYFQSVEKAKPKSKFFYRFNYNGGSFEADLRLIDCIMIYGATGNLPVSFLDSLRGRILSDSELIKYVNIGFAGEFVDNLSLTSL